LPKIDRQQGAHQPGDIISYRRATSSRNQWATSSESAIEIVKRAADVAGFQLLPRRWVVERTFAWLNRNRRLAKDFEASIATAKAWVYIASAQLLIRRLACP
jgi:transposase